MRLALGTAQFGLDYGITNEDGKVEIEEVGNILEVARNNEIDTIDTAIAYGSSEKTLGSFDLSKFKVITKIPSLERSTKIELRKQVEGSLERLNINKLYGLMLHRELDALDKNDDKIFKQLLELKKLGLVEKVGISFYSPEIALSVLNNCCLDIIQVPANQLDNRFLDNGVISLANKLGVEVHARSLFLQGLLMVSASRRPDKFQGHRDLDKFDEQAKILGVSVKELAMNYLLQNNNISKGVIGCTSTEQFLEVISTYNKLKNLNIPDLELYSRDMELINPSLW